MAVLAYISAHIDLKNVLYGAKRLGFHFKQVLFRLMQTQLDSWHDEKNMQTDRWLQLYIADSLCFTIMLTWILEKRLE